MLGGFWAIRILLLLISRGVECFMKWLKPVSTIMLELLRVWPILPPECTKRASCIWIIRPEISFGAPLSKAMRIGPVSMHDGLRNLRRLWGPKHFFTAIVHRYAVLRGFDPAVSKQFALAQRARFWKRYGRRHDISFQLDL